MRMNVVDGREARADATAGRILGLALPMALEMSMQSFVVLADAFFVARLGSVALAAVGLTAVGSALMLTFAWGLGEAAAAMISRRVGAGDHDAASTVATTVLLLGTGVATIFSVFGALGAKSFLQAMGGSAELAAVGTSYAVLLFAGSAPLWVLQIGNSILRAAARPSAALRVLILTNVVNLVLDPCLIFGWGPFPELGLTGAAIATLLGWSAGAAYLVFLLLRDRSLRLLLERRGWDPAAARRSIQLAAPATVNYLAAEAALLMVFRLVAFFGPAALAAFTLCTRFQIAYSLSSGLGNAAKTLIGQSLGAGRADQAESLTWRVSWFNLAVLFTVAGVYVVFGEQLLRLFSSDPEVVALAWQCLLWVSTGFAFQAFGDVVEQALIGAGDTKTPAVVGVGCLWLCQLPLAYLLGITFNFGPVGVFAALGMSQFFSASALIFRFRSGSWKEQTV